MCQYKILNLSNGKCFNGAVSLTQYDMPDFIFATRKAAEDQVDLIVLTSDILRIKVIRKEYLEIIEVEDTNASQEA